MPAVKEGSGSDAEARLMNKKVLLVEKHFGVMAEQLETVNRTGHKIVDRTEAFAQSLQIYGEAETPGVQATCNAVSQCLQQVQVHQRAELNQVAERVIDELKAYSGQCKMMKDEIAERERLKDKQLAKTRALERLQIREPTSTSKIKQAKNELAGTATEVKQAEQAMIESMVRFESKKLDSLKGMLADLLTAQMVYHARALELCTEAYGKLHHISRDVDLRELTLLQRSQPLAHPQTPGQGTGQPLSRLQELQESLRRGEAMAQVSNTSGYPDDSVGTFGTSVVDHSATSYY